MPADAASPFFLADGAHHLTGPVGTPNSVVMVAARNPNVTVKIPYGSHPKATLSISTPSIVIVRFSPNAVTISVANPANKAAQVTVTLGGIVGNVMNEDSNGGGSGGGAVTCSSGDRNTLVATVQLPGNTTAGSTVSGTCRVTLPHF